MLATRAVPTIIDRTMTFDPVNVWPDALDCPDWPLLTDTMRYDGPRGRYGAEARLESVAAFLNRGEGRLTAPDDNDREQVIARTFKRSPGKWGGLGFPDLSPLGILAEQDAELIVEACHLRGYLRKLDALEVKAATDKERLELAQARHTLDSYGPEAAGEMAEYAKLAEAAARHKQSVADEAAFHRCRMLRGHVESIHAAAVSAARRLGEEPPVAPDFG
jgi:hypothetical protein